MPLEGSGFDAAPGTPLRLVTAQNASPDLLFPADYEQAFTQAWGV